MTIKFNGVEKELVYTFKAYLYYENIMGKSFVPEDLNKFTNIVSLFYSFCLATYKRDKQDFKLTYDEFIDWIDENGGEMFLIEFINWFTKEIQRKGEVLKPTDNNEESDDKKKVRTS